MNIKRRLSRVVKIGTVSIGGAHPVAVQSMTKVKASDIEKTLRQIKQLEKAGCEIVRLAVKDSADAKAIKRIKSGAKIPIVADIHFDWRLALQAIDSGADKIRLNPGNISGSKEIAEVVAALRCARIPLRIGLNSGSVKYAGASLSMPEKLARSCLDYLRIIEKLKFYDIVISLKASTVLDTVEAYRRISGACDYPLHLGLTATGAPFSGAIKSGIAVGSLLMEGIGDTVRVSLTDEPKQEVLAAQCILAALGLRNFGPEIISCPTCGRCEVNLVKLVAELEEKLAAANLKPTTRPLKVAVMGCVVNGPGEAKEADIGVAFGKGQGLLFKKGKAIKKVAFGDCAKLLLAEMRKIK
jgi:(E)-4-hydroxy-3-methylbut-2-enyl-diphosphate synthase